MGSLFIFVSLAFIYSMFGVVCLFVLRIPIRINWILLFTLSGLVFGTITMLLFLLIAGDGNWKLPSANLVDATLVSAFIISVIGSVASVKVGKNIISASNSNLR